jgi:hypothetical protein
MSEMSVYDQCAPLLIAMGQYPLPIEPGTKKPAIFINGAYEGFTAWTTATAPITMPQPEAGIGLRMGNALVAVDIDTNDEAMMCAIIDALMPAGTKTITKIGQRGETLFFRLSPGQQMDSKKFLIDGATVAELLASGRQTVLPPTIHPDTKKPYVWGNGLTLYNIDIQTLPVLPADAVERIAAALAPFGYKEENKPVLDSESGGPFREINELALSNLAKWVPDLGLYKCARRPGRVANYQAVPTWRPSSTGRATELREPNLKISPRGIKDMGTGKTYTAIDLVLAAGSATSVSEAVTWLDERLGWSHGGPKVDFEAIAANAERKETKGEQTKKERKIRFRIKQFWEIRPNNDIPYLIKGLFPRRGIAVVWGPPKCLKSFFVLDATFHIARGVSYHGRRVQQGTVLYCAFEGGHGNSRRIEALRRYYKLPEDDRTPLPVMDDVANLIKDHGVLIQDILFQLDGEIPICVVLDTLNKSIQGSESKDDDMGAYIRAAEVIRTKFDCLVIIVHHCGWNDTRMRGHSSLLAALDTEISVKREGNIMTATVESNRDGVEGAQIIGRSKEIVVGEDSSGDH